jgi:AraC family transcriptional activator of pobA
MPNVGKYDFMRKKMDLKAFNLYQYLKENFPQPYDAPFFIANQDTYAKAAIRFPFRTFTYGIGITYSGTGGLFKIGSMEYETRAGSLITIGPGIVSQWMSGYDSVHDTVYFSEELFKNTLKNSFLKALPFFSPGGHHVIPLEEESVEKMQSLFRSLKLFRDDTEVAIGIIYSLVMLVVRFHRVQSKNKNTVPLKEKLAGDFRSLLSRHFLENKDVTFYAARLNVSPKYLSEVLVGETGKTAKALIDEHIFQEAKSLLRQTSMTIQEICYWLGYADTSYFTKAFKQKEGMTPMAYRKL